LFDLAKWNVADNREWFVRLSDAGSGIAVDLYHTLADAQAETNRQAFGASSTFGSAVEIELGPDAADSVAKLQPEYFWHLVVSGQDGDPDRILRVGAFVELPEIAHSIYRDSRLIEARATAEIDAHTHADIARTVTLGTHLPELEPGEIARLNSARRGIDALGQVTGHRIAGGLNRLTSELDISFYMELKR